MFKTRMVKSFLAVYLFFSIFSIIVIVPPSISDNNNTADMSQSLGNPLGPEETADAVKKIQNLQTSIHAISASVVQKKKNPLLKKEIETEGTIALKKPNLLHWDLTKPERLSIIIDGSVMWLYHPDLNEAQRYAVSEQFMVRQSIEFFTSTMNISVDEMNRRFDILVYKHDNDFVFELKPKSSIVANYLAAIYVWYREAEGVPYRFEIIGKKGNSAATELKDIVVNPPLEKNTFHFDVPPGVTITNMNRENEKERY